MSNTDYRHLLPEAFAADSRVWIYQSNRLFSLSEAIQIEDLLEKFTFNWQSHGVPVEGYANLFFGQFIVLMADESATGVSGCSTDSSVRLIKEIETLFSVTLFDRQLLAFIIKDNIQLLPLPQLQYAINNNCTNKRRTGKQLDDTCKRQLAGQKVFICRFFLLVASSQPPPTDYCTPTSFLFRYSTRMTRLNGLARIFSSALLRTPKQSVFIQTDCVQKDFHGFFCFAEIKIHLIRVPH